MADAPILVRVPKELKREIQRSARANDRNVSQEVRKLLRETFMPALPAVEQR